MNRCTFIGNFVHDPRLNKQDKSGTNFTNFRLSIKHKFKKSNRELGSHVAYLDFEAWDSGAEVICSRFKKGDPIVIEAMAKSYRDEDKNNIVFRVEHFEHVPKQAVEIAQDDST